MGERLFMAAHFPEASPNSPEQASIEGLVAACRDQANQSRKFRTRENQETGTRFSIVDAHDTTYVVAFNAEHCIEGGNYSGHSYVVGLSVSHELVDMVPEELARLARESDEPVIGPDDIGLIKAEYWLETYFDDNDTLQWTEGRCYSIWFVDDEGNLCDPEGDGLDANSRKSYYFLNLGLYFPDDDEECAPVQKAREDVEELRFKETFELMMGRAGLSSYEKRMYVKKAHELFKTYLLGQEAEFKIENYFPDDVVQTINAQHTT